MDKPTLKQRVIDTNATPNWLRRLMVTPTEARTAQEDLAAYLQQFKPFAVVGRGQVDLQVMFGYKAEGPSGMIDYDTHFIGAQAVIASRHDPKLNRFLDIWEDKPRSAQTPNPHLNSMGFYPRLPYTRDEQVYFPTIPVDVLARIAPTLEVEIRLSDSRNSKLYPQERFGVQPASELLKYLAADYEQREQEHTADRNANAQLLINQTVHGRAEDPNSFPFATKAAPPPVRVPEFPGLWDDEAPAQQGTSQAAPLPSTPEGRTSAVSPGKFQQGTTLPTNNEPGKRSGHSPSQ